MQIQFKKLHLEAIEPFRAHPDDAALDLFAVIDGTRHLGPLGIAKIPTGIAMAIPPGYCGVIKGRSGLGSNGVNVLGGVIDSGYLGEIIVLLQTASDMAVRTGDKIAQLLIVPVPQVTLAEVPEFPTVSERGENGFGSTDAPFKGILHGAAATDFQSVEGVVGYDEEGHLHGAAALSAPSRDVAASTGLFTAPKTFEVGKSHREAAWDVLEERSRQRAKGWDATHDASHEPETLLNAAHAYLLATEAVLHGERADKLPGVPWPWDGGFKASPDPTRNAVKAAALLAAFVDRMRQAHDENRVPVNPAEREDTDAR